LVAVVAEFRLVYRAVLAVVVVITRLEVPRLKAILVG
jgi:hypothetical protein